MSTRSHEKRPSRTLGARKRRSLKESSYLSGSNSPDLATAWELYNRRAAIFDKELVKDWNDSLSTLLIFAALYSAVLTAFITQSMQMLAEDPTDTTRAILLVITRQLANASTPAFEPEPFVAPSYAVRVNAYFFVSILCSLVAALGAVLALQWVGNYDSGLNPSSPKIRALQRQYRFKAMQEWKMPEIIASLPLFLFAALFLFLIGLAEWLFHINIAISVIIMIGLFLATLFYAFTTVLSARQIDAPFRTEVTKTLTLMLDELWKVKDRFFSFSGSMRSPDFPSEEDSSIKREEIAIKSKPFLELDSLLWIAKSIDVLPHSRGDFEVLIEEIMDLPTDQLLDPRINDAPWFSIFTMLSQPYHDKFRYGGYRQEELREDQLHFLVRGVAMIGNKPFVNATGSKLEKFLSSLDNLDLDVDCSELRAYAWFARWRRLKGNSQREITHETLKAIMGNIRVLPRSFLKLSFLAFRERQSREVDLFQQSFFSILQINVGRFCDLQPEEFSVTSLIPLDIMNTILHLMAIDISGHPQPHTDPLVAYLISFETAKVGDRLDDHSKRAYRAIRRQFIARLAQSFVKTHDPQELEDLVTPLFHMLQGISGIDQADTRRDIHALFSVASPSFLAALWSHPNMLSAKIISLAFCNKPTFGTDNWSNWLIQISLGCDERLREGHCDPGIVIPLFCNTLAFFKIEFTSSGRNVFDKLTLIDNPQVALAITALSGFSATIPVLESLPENIWDDPVWQDTVQWCCDLMEKLVVQWARPRLDSSFITITRTALVRGSRATKEQCVSMIANLRYRYLSTTFFHLFQGSTLNDLLLIQDDTIHSTRLDILQWISDLPWFSEEFRKVDGFTWLRWNISSNDDYERVIKLAANAITSAKSHSQVLECVTITRECLTRCSLGNVKFSDQAKRFQTVLDRMSEDRFGGLVQTRNYPRVETPSPSGDDSVASHENLLSPTSYAYVKNWTLSEWSEWCMLAKEVVEGLLQGYIVDYIPYFTSDPDNLCMRLVNYR